MPPKIRHILLHWGYELREKYFFLNAMYKKKLLSVYETTNLAKSKKKGYFKEKAAEYYLKNKEVKKKMSKN